MSASILSALLLVSPAPLPSTAQPPSLVEPQSGAWAVAYVGELWICWSPGPDCFERVVFDEAPPDPEDVVEETDFTFQQTYGELVEEPEEPEDIDLGVDTWFMGFAGPRNLWIEHGEQRWRIIRGQRRARMEEDPAPIRLERMSPAECGPAGLVPALISGQLSFREAPRCAVEATATSCVTRSGPRVRKPTPVRIKAGIEIVTARSWKTKDDFAIGLPVAHLRSKNDLDIKLFVQLGFDWHRRHSSQQSRALLARRSEARLRPLPKVKPGPLADDELEALTAIVCAGGTR